MKYNRGKLWFIKQEFWFIIIINHSLQFTDILTENRIRNLDSVMLTRNQLALIFCRIVFYGFEFPAIFAFTSLCLRLAGWRQARQPVSAATRFVTQTLSFCHIRGFLRSNSSNLTSAACAVMSQSFALIRKLSSSQTGYLLLFEIKLFVSVASSWLILVICQVRYTGYRDRPIHERQNKFLSAARDGSTEIVSILFIILTL